jgi:AcrR family transcriptional regulator
VTTTRPAGTGRAAPLPPEQRRAAILRVAIPMISELGTDVTTKQIATAAGIAEGTIFRVFPDKDALIRAAVEEVFDPVPTLAALAGIDRSLPLRERLIAVVNVLRDRMSRLWAILGALRLMGPPDQHAGHRHLPASMSNEMTTAAVLSVLDSAAPELRYDPAQVARILRLFVFAGTHPRITEGAPWPTEDVVDILLDGVRRRADDPSP